ncbi:hypothetical protein Mnod_3731 [Methylobacterium nodulans ORS 2060]|uniref:Uncharacterized protein n=1 Tax=Methylobacterium nodulans (strain LMG 21967 / CNCM I-2342 / ORS 2060) TaxID=460265 RepID=B8IR98_METNO|nr:hypothetical protein Mnod_3731 [Methylobacterium nodulans ORS 2060]
MGEARDAPGIAGHDAGPDPEDEAPIVRAARSADLHRETVHRLDICGQHAPESGELDSRRPHCRHSPPMWKALSSRYSSMP